MSDRTNLYLNDLVQKQLKAAMEYAGRQAMERVDGIAAALFDRRWEFATHPECASPLEASFWIWWTAADAARTMGAVYWLPLNLDSEHHIVGQGKATYRVDFRVVLLSQGVGYNLVRDIQRFDLVEPKIGVELDGHEFHERTKEQVTYRNKRDRDLQRMGWKLFHYSGSEFVREPLRCVEEVWDFSHDAFLEVHQQAHIKRQGDATGSPS